MRVQYFITFPAAAAVVILISMTAAAQELTAVSAPWPPYVIHSGGEISGADVEIVTSVFETLGFTLAIKIKPWKRCISDIKLQKADMIIGAGKTTERLFFLIYPEEHVSTCTWALFFRKDNPFTYQGLESLSGKTIGTLLGYYYGDEFITSTDFRRDHVTSITQNLKKLLSRRIDLMIENKQAGLYTAKKIGVMDQIGFTKNELATGALIYTAFSKKDTHIDLAAEFSKTLKEFKKTESYRKLLEKYGL